MACCGSAPRQEPEHPIQSPEEGEFRIILVGKAGGGKSSTGNTLLGEKHFEAGLSQKAVTQTCSAARWAKEWQGKRVVIVDTPASFYTSIKLSSVSAEIEKCASLTRAAPHALVFVTQVGRFTKEDCVALERVEKIFGKEAAKKMIVLFTRKEDLEGESLENYIQQSGNKALQDLVRKCSGRYCAFNNKATGSELASQAEELLSLVEKMLMEENRGRLRIKDVPGESKKRATEGRPEAAPERPPRGGREKGLRGAEGGDEHMETGEPGRSSQITEENQLWIVLVGKAGGGKSSTGNTLLGEKLFQSGLSQKAVTQTSTPGIRAKKWQGKRVTVVDTPASFYASAEHPQPSLEIEKCLSLTSPGPHALVFVTQVGRFTKEDCVALKRVEEIFGKEAAKKMIVLFTRKEDLEGESLEYCIQQSGNKALQDLVRKCSGRCCAFNNKATGSELASQVEELLSLVEKMLKEENRGKLPTKDVPKESKKRAAEGRQAGVEVDLEKPPAGGDVKVPRDEEGLPGSSLQPPGQGRDVPSGPDKMETEESGDGGKLPPERELRLVLVGKAGGGKSSTGNTLLGEKHFESGLSQKGKTQTCSAATRAKEWQGKRVVVVDTLGSEVLSSSPAEIEKCASLTRAAPHALVFVTQVGRFTKEDCVALERVEEIFTKEATKKMIVLFTRKEDLEGESLENYIQQSGNKALQDSVRKCGGRYCAFNNKATGSELASQAEELLSLVEKMLMEENRGRLRIKDVPGESKKRATEGRPEAAPERPPRGGREKGLRGAEGGDGEERMETGGSQHPSKGFSANPESRIVEEDSEMFVDLGGEEVDFN